MTDYDKKVKDLHKSVLRGGHRHILDQESKIAIAYGLLAVADAIKNIKGEENDKENSNLPSLSTTQ